MSAKHLQRYVDEFQWRQSAPEHAVEFMAKSAMKFEGAFVDAQTIS